MDDWKLKPAADLHLPAGERWRSLRRENGLLETAGHLIWWGLIRAYLAVYHRLEIQDREHLPLQPPFILAANHASHLDVLALAAPLPWRLRDRIFPIAAGDTFFETPALAAFSAYAVNALPMWRRNCGSHALEALRDRLIQEPCAYILFPEGSRTRDGKMSSFKPGLGRLVAGTDVPVVPAYLSGTFQAMPPGRRFPRPGKIVLRFGSPLLFTDKNNDRAGWTKIASEVEAAVRCLENRASCREAAD